MRFYQFETTEGSVYVDLDCIHGIKPDPNRRADRTIVATPSGAVTVSMPINDVLALVAPKPAQAEPPPDVGQWSLLYPYEKGRTTDRPREQFGRLEELDFLIKACGIGTGIETIRQYITNRRVEVGEGKF